MQSTDEVSMSFALVIPEGRVQNESKSLENGVELQNISVNNMATEQISHQHQQSLAKLYFSAVIGGTSPQDFCAGIAKPIMNIK